ncbi:MAG: hypothetical protein ACI9QL_003364 [Candidatus Omnitrophota bacterium]|jgi:hypothetical protein
MIGTRVEHGSYDRKISTIISDHRKTFPGLFLLSENPLECGCLLPPTSQQFAALGVGLFCPLEDFELGVAVAEMVDQVLQLVLVAEQGP